MFRIHFNLLYKTGPDDATMPSLFQARLEGSSLMKQPFEVAYGSVVTLKSRLEGGGLLHSHAHKYPTGSGGQQITCYGHKDNNNEFMIVYVDNNDNMGAYDDIKYVKEGMVVRLMHKNTNTTLQVSKQHKAPLTSQMFEVNGSGDVNVINRPSDQWQVEIVKTLGKMSKRSGNGMDDRVVTTLSTEFRLKNVDANCYLGLSGKPLPDWGYSQSEVGCIKPNSALFGNTIWNVEFQVNSRLPNADPASLKTRFVDDFVHLNKAMYRTNNALLPDNDKIDHLTSPPISWPFLIFGLRMCGWDADRFKYLMLGNPVTWWGSTFAVLVTFPLYILYLLLSYKRTGNLGPLARSAGYIVPASILWGGWLLHYLPFFIMGRVTYLHHYFPSLYFQNLFMALQLSHFFNLYYSKLESICKSKLKFNSNSKSISKSKSTATITATKISIFIKSNWWVILCVISTAVFLFFSPLTFGFNRDASELWTRQWLPSWKVHD
ncbi:Dolichyl-phosphate-mannose-protein mannosyltransferase 2 [Zancudomyces culisetae]|uniref:Dolichyl-phosphate-mannose--protein mannosyltransferase n=1 Tax=Zancudomyces culisetae TaxID=1213189 RepID=A0A1R1PCT7_ZANCU|nr:Dolichyl-phosphate-mannose-protein mannosyltransferase 2 [Zancudomyces culisetae]|eukprot:OMH78795.1 Dolichyl-phosphate-mannose-protein mannosyltransferase 2 [Zancudomyces culisetae]